MDITPEVLPVLVNGSFNSRTVDTVKTRVNARALVLDDGRERLALVVADSCMMPRDLLDEAKQLAAKRTQIRPDRMLISATHSHSAPSCMGALGTDADPNYVPLLREKLAEAIAAAEANLEPARVGFAKANAADFTAVRRWIYRPDRVQEDPFGNRTVRATMHAATKTLDDVTGPSGPEDPDLSLIAIQSRAGRPLAVLANFSMHYFGGEQGLSADYFGLFCEGLRARLASGETPNAAPFVGILSHNCSGDIWRRDYWKPASEHEKWTIQAFADGLLDIAVGALGGIAYQDDVDLAMAETRLPLMYRVPDAQRIEWAQRIVDAMGDRLPQERFEVYAREQIILHERQATEVVVQALRVGDIAIATTPTETYALTGLKLKAQSPLPDTIVIELANGGDGYIPPPEQHVLGGYNTWAARSAGLEVQAEPKITEVALRLLEQVTDTPRRAYMQSRGPAAQAVLDAGPAAYWRLDDFAGPRARDIAGKHNHAIYEPGVVFFLEGPNSESFCLDGETNRAAHFAGGRLDARVAGLGESYTVSLWFWNGMPTDARGISGWLFSRGRGHGLDAADDHLGILGTGDDYGKLVFQHGTGDAAPVVGRTATERWTWNHVVFVRDGATVRAYLNGNMQPEFEAEVPAGFPEDFDQFYFGGRGDNQDNWEGRLDEVAIYDPALEAKAVERLAGK